VARVVREDFFVSAFATLAEQGFPSVTAAGLCLGLGVTRGSFYHHFDSFDDFITGLIDYWRQMYTEDLVAQARESSGSLMELLRNCVRLAAALPHDTEIALRAWGTVNVKVHEAVHRVDELRVTELTDAMAQYGLPASVAHKYSRLSLAGLVGAQMTKTPLTEDYLNDIFALLQRDLAGEALSRQMRGRHRSDS
jgi:AcrR family transcriptional regulator